MPLRAVEPAPPVPVHAPLQVQYQPLADLVPYVRNARRHTPAQITKIKASLMEFGWANVMLVADRGMIAGHARLAAALALRAEGKVIPFTPDPDLGPTIDLSHLTVPQRRAFVLADNRLAEEAAWDHDLLRVEFEELMADGGLELTLAGFGAGEISSILNGWTTDFARQESVAAELTALQSLLKVRCNSADVQRVSTAIKDALAAAGIEGARLVE
jgi:ParB-like chromosome segregation protein Spo0J